MTPIFFTYSLLRRFQHQVREQMAAKIALWSNKDLLSAQNSKQVSLCSGKLNPEDLNLTEHGNEGGVRGFIFSESTVGV